MGNFSFRNDFEHIEIKKYLKWMEEQDVGMALIKYEGSYLWMNKQHANFFGFEDNEEANIFFFLNYFFF
jgi:hypothetical protein